MSDAYMWEFEDKYAQQGLQYICGVDEAGRGPLAGPVYAAAVILPSHIAIPGLNDSKKLSDKRRRELVPIIKENAIAYCVAFVDHARIDEINILQATYQAMEQAIKGLSVVPEVALIDGNRAKDFGVCVETIVKGDSRSASIAAASILAKVARDDLMLKLAQEYPQYGFDIHKGYGTKAHYEALQKHGPSPVHRMTFLKKLYGTQ